MNVIDNTTATMEALHYDVRAKFLCRLRAMDPQCVKTLLRIEDTQELRTLLAGCSELEHSDVYLKGLINEVLTEQGAR